MSSKIELSSSTDVQLSIIVRVVGGGEFLKRCLDHLLLQNQDGSIEIIVPIDSSVSNSDRIQGLFPQVSFIDTGEVKGVDLHNPGVAHELYDYRTAAGLHAARGSILALIEDYGYPDDNWCTQIITAHLLPYGIIGGAVEQAASRLLNWAIYFLDFGRYQPPLKEGPTNYLTDVNISYKRYVLEAVRNLWVNSYNEVTVNWGLAHRGEVLWLRPQVRVKQDRGQLSFPKVVKERFYFGRLFASKRVREISSRSRLFYILISPMLPFVLIGRLINKVFSGGQNRGVFLLSLPYMFIISVVWGVGELAGYLTPSSISIKSAK